jgi:hypothetical protein
VVGPYANYIKAIGRSQEALDNADMHPKDKVEWQRQINKHKDLATQMKDKINAQLDVMCDEAADLAEPVQIEVAVRLGLIAPPEREVQTEEADVTSQLLADAEDPVAKAKQERLQQKQQSKEIMRSATEFLETQETRVKDLVTSMNVKGVQEQTKALNETMAPALEARAKVVTEEETAHQPDKEGVAAYQEQQVLRKLDQQLREVSPGLGPDTDKDTDAGTTELT